MAWASRLSAGPLLDKFPRKKTLSCTNSIRSAGDHNLIQVRIRLKGSSTKGLDTMRRDYRNFNPTQYRELLGEISWQEIYSITRTDLAYDFLEQGVLSVLNKLSPMKTSQFNKHRKPWISDRTKDLMAQRDTTHEAAMTSQLPDRWKSYRTLRNSCSRELNRDRKKFFKEKYEMFHDTKDIKATYNMAKTQAGWKSAGPPTSFLINGKTISKYQDMAEIQKCHFKKKVEDLISNLPPPLVKTPAPSCKQLLTNGEQPNAMEGLFST